MEKKLNRVFIVIIALVAAAAGYFLRALQLSTMIDASGKLLANAGNSPITWLSIVFAVAAAVYSFLLQKRTRLPQEHTKLTATGAMALGVAAAFLSAMGGVASWQTDLSVALCAMVTAICWVVIALQLQQGIVPSPVSYIVAALAFAADLIFKFRLWSLDPQIMDYCFDLFFGISIMCAVFHLGGFSFGKGSRRRAVFFCLCGVFFGAVSMAGKELPQLVITLGGVIWMLGGLWLMLAPEMAEAEDTAEKE